MEDYKKVLAKKYNLDIRVVNLIVNHPFKFLRDLIEGSSERAFLMRRIGTFVLRPRKTKYTSVLKVYMSVIKKGNYKRDVEYIVNTYKRKVRSYEEANEYVEHLLVELEVNDLKDIQAKLVQFKKGR
jgi:ribosomal protein S17E